MCPSLEYRWSPAAPKSSFIPSSPDLTHTEIVTPPRVGSSDEDISGLSARRLFLDADFNPPVMERHLPSDHPPRRPCTARPPPVIKFSDGKTSVGLLALSRQFSAFP